MNWLLAYATPGHEVTIFDPYAGWGTHTFQVQAVNAQGQPLGPLASYTWTTTFS